jgi:hypothetical protein
LNDIVGMIQEDKGELERSTLSSMIIHSVHLRDNIFYMDQIDVRSAECFEWQSHPRYYLTYQIPHVKM